MSEEGGEAVCWLNRVCPACGALNERPEDLCWRCGEPIVDRDESPPEV
jgi:predicted amidophosphoribosyltransferase